MLGASSNIGDANAFYKEKLEHEIEENEEAANILISISFKLTKIIEMFRATEGFNEESTEVKDLLNIMGGIDDSFQSSSMASDEDDSEQNNM